MRTLSLRDLKRRPTRALLLRLRAQREAVELTHRGRVVALLLPVESEPPSKKELAAVWSELDRLASEIGAAWPEGVSAVDAVREQRREL